MLQTDNELALEADRLHRVAFGSPAPAELVSRYVELHRALPLATGATLEVDLSRLAEPGLDIEAIELALRLRRQDNTLSRKLYAVFYLAEVRSVYFDRFVQRRDDRPRAFCRLIGIGAGTLWKFLKGSYLVWRLRVV